ncbi:MAG: hydantoinase/oxoprolinase family protein, partial [Rhodospirillaceae bacterium]|nr:hydantoinase/oxoprolinase family protein [Rhodospirillaceae bacterium]
MHDLPPSHPAQPWRIGVDVGGTFTDLVLHDAAGLLFVAKVPSTPEDPAKGVIAAVERLAGDHGLDATAVLAGCDLFVHGSTVATNTMLEGKGAKVGMITTKGFRDSLEIRRGMREDMWDHRTPFAPVLVPRFLRIGVDGRLDRDGVELTALDTGAVADAAALFRENGVESVAVCLLNSFLDPVHERQAGEALSQVFDPHNISLSTTIAPIMGEYERGSTAVVNAYLAPRVVPYLQRLDESLRDMGLRHPMLLVQSNGGAASVAQVAARPVNLALSGPASAVGALNLVAEQTGHDDLISMEIGGTSCDVVMMHKGDVALADDLMIAGYHVGTPAIDVHTVGAGGGTIAHVDAGGMLQLGPQGAGAVPGPACYGLGGEHPTVTDALLVLGRLREGTYAGGAVTLDGAAARKALETHVATPLGLSVADAAAGIISILEQNLLHAVERISIERGYDPSACFLVAAGGAGPMHGSAVARQLGCRTVYIPRQAGAFCALGMLNADVRRDVSRVLIANIDTVEAQSVETGYGDLEREATGVLASEGFTDDRATTERAMDLRYRGQQWSIRVPA